MKTAEEIENFIKYILMDVELEYLTIEPIEANRRLTKLFVKIQDLAYNQALNDLGEALWQLDEYKSPEDVEKSIKTLKK